MARRFSALFLLTLLSVWTIAASPAAAASISWANPVSGAWSDTLNWNPQQIPGPDDIAFITLSGDYTVTVDVDADPSRFALGAPTGTQTLTVDGQTITISSGVASTIVQGGLLELLNGGTVTGASTLRNIASLEMDDGVVESSLSNQGSLVAGGSSSLLGAVTTNGNSIIRVSNSSTLTISNGFTNNNLILLTGEACSLAVENGTLTNPDGSFFTVTGAGDPRTLAAELDNLGTVSVNTDFIIDSGSAAHTNGGLINCLAGNLTVIQSGSDPTLTNTGEIRISDGLALTVDGGGFENAVGGQIGGNGTLDVSGTDFTQAGNLSPGTSPGILTVIGPYIQSSTGSLQIEIGGLAEGTEFDRLEVSGSASLDGTLAISLLDGFFPHDGDAFEVMTYDSRTGAFADTTSLELGGGITLIPQYGPTSLVLLATMEPSIVQPIAPEGCITADNPCVTIPFEIVQSNPQEVRAYSVTFSINSDLQLCDGLNSIVEGNFLSGYCGGGCTFFQVHDNEDGTFTVDATILGGDCGPDSSGTLFTVDLTHTGADGTGVVAITDVAARDCSNGDLSISAGLPIEVGIDIAPPPQITDLAASQIKTANDDDGTTMVEITFTGDVGGDTMEIFRKGFGDYPEYDDGTGQVPTAPATPEDALAEGWTLTAVTLSGETDEPPTRDYWYYIAFVTSHCDLHSVSNMTEGTLNYHLGDVSNGVDTCEGNNLVGTIDVSFLGDHYFATGGDVDSVNCLDFGPTDDGSVDGLPMTDNAIDFEELVLIGINFGEVSIPKQAAALMTSRDADTEEIDLILSVDGARVRPDNTLAASLSLQGNIDVTKAIHAVIRYDRDRLRLIGVEQGGLLEEQTAGLFFDWIESDGSITIDSAILGRNETFIGSGEVALLQFQTLGLTARPSLTEADLRDLDNQKILDSEVAPVRPLSLDRTERPATLPTETRLLGARPNPSSGGTGIAFALAAETHVSVRIHDVGGRLVRTLINRPLNGGVHSVAWDGRSDDGHLLPTGVYLYSFRAGSVEETQKLIVRR